MVGRARERACAGSSAEEVGSEPVVPIVRDGEIVGTLDVEERHPAAFTPQDEQLFAEVARALASLYR